MTVRDVQDAAAALARLAAERDLKDVQRFLSTLPAPGDARIELRGAEVDLAGLGDWVAARTSTAVDCRSLEAFGAEPAAALVANRMLVVLRCGRLLTPDVVDAAAAALARPRGSYLIVLVGAETLGGSEDLALVQRGLWRVLVGDPGVEWSGQDLAERGCLLFSTTPADQHTVAERISTDMRRLADWVSAGVTLSAKLGQARVECALDLAERELAVRVRPPLGDHAGDVAALRAAAAALRERLLGRLEADLAAMEKHIAASLQTLEQDLLGGVERRLGRAPEALSGPALTATVSAYLAEAGRAWRADAVEFIQTRLRRTSDQTADLLDEVDWARVNDAVSAVGGRVGYPDLILDRLSFGTPLPMVPPDSLTESTAPPGPSSPWVPALRRAAYGGVAAAASLAVLGPVLLPAVAAGALGAAGGTLADMQLTGARDRRAAAAYAREAVASTMAEFASTVRARVRQSTNPIQAAVAAEFDVLDAALSLAVQETTVRDADVESSSGTDTLADIRRALLSGRTPRNWEGI
jgi:hypothetical protein